MIKLLITGANGQLGKCLTSYLKWHKLNIEYTALDLPDFNISDSAHVKKYVEEGNYDYVINCAAYTNVNQALTDENTAILANGYGPKLLAEACKKTKARLIHISTDYVFDGSPETKTEDSVPAPVNTYGRTKLLGDTEIMNAAKDGELEYMIFRTSWLYSEYGNNFVKTIINKLKNNEEIKVVDDQYGSPTYAGDLAKAIVDIILENKFATGIYNFSNMGIITWYDFAYGIYQFYREIMKEQGIVTTAFISPCKTSEFPSPVERPKFGILSKDKVINTLGISIKHWTVPLKNVVEKLTY